MTTNLSDQEQFRRDALTELRNIDIEPYPAASYEVNNTAKNIHDTYPEKQYPAVSLAGRLMTKRIMGKASFAELQDSS